MAIGANKAVDVEAVHGILALLAKIVKRGLAPEQRETVFRGMPVGPRIEQFGGELQLLKALLDEYERVGDLGFVVSILGRIESTRTFYQDVGQDLDRLRYLVRSLPSACGRTDEVPYVFVLMPFTDEMFILYESTIKPTLEGLGCRVQHSKEADTVDRIIDTIFSQIAAARFLVADTSGRNANVFYEVGYAHGIGKQVILLTQDTTHIPFNLSGLPHIAYEATAPHVLRRDLTRVAVGLLDEKKDPH